MNGIFKHGRTLAGRSLVDARGALLRLKADQSLGFPTLNDDREDGRRRSPFLFVPLPPVRPLIP